MAFIGFIFIVTDDSPVCGITGASNYLITWSLFDCGVSLLGLEMSVVEYYEN